MFWMACAPKEEQVEANPDTLEGSWKLTSYLADGDSVWQEYTDDVIYLKHVTPTHFTWIRFNKNENAMAGTGGGTYKYDGKTYTEDITFFHPPGSNELGQAIPFDVTFKDGKWYHTGYARVLEFDPEIGESVVVDSSKIEEIWSRVEIKSEPENQELLGTWNLSRYKELGDSVYSEYPDFVKYLKLITPTHFIWIYYNEAGDEVVAEGGGTWSYENDVYSEVLDFVHPPVSGLTGVSLPFEFDMEDGRWYHKGWSKVAQTDPETGEEKTVETRVDEVWKAYKEQGI